MNNDPMMIFLQMMGMGNSPEQIMKNIQNNSQFKNVYNQFQNLKKGNKTNQELVMQIVKENRIDIQPMLNLLGRSNHIK